ncbi:NHL repeat-containing protein [Methylococcus mesophilus]|uniref:hypothetical protein n=1 Tax=Methylococcus mesophilus TaxID=2993564 RepID=UPI00224A6EC6|nr:hypothetical protein [Methylococcus mesophilus]UZR30859.1 hypothetical protein OOT43_09585 [Methylococcus mesophilus]
MNSNRFAGAIITAALLFLTATAGWAGLLQSPYGLAVNPNNGYLYIADPLAGKVFVAQPGSRAGATFVSRSNPFTLVVDKNGSVYVGRVGADGKIDIFDAQGKLITSWPVADSPTQMTIDPNNVVYQANVGNAMNSWVVLHVYGNDLSPAYQQAAASGGLPYFKNFIPLMTVDSGKHYAFAYDNGQIMIIGGDGVSSGVSNPNITDVSMFALVGDGTLQEFQSKMYLADQAIGGGAYLDWLKTHTIDTPGSVSAATVDGFHNVFYVDQGDQTIKITAKTRLAKPLLNNLPSRPWGIALDQTRSKLYVSFPDEHLVRAYGILYVTTNGVKVPKQLSAPTIIR